jgi:molecular chaperone DnaK (HSP70)
MTKVSHAIGIDLGTIYSRVGIWRNDTVEIILNDQVFFLESSLFIYSREIVPHLRGFLLHPQSV